MTYGVTFPTPKTTFPFLLLLCHSFTSVARFCCNTYSSGPPERFIDWEVCGSVIEYVLDDGSQYCLHSSDLRTDIQNLTRHVSRETLMDKIQLSCRESLLYVDVQGEIQCVEDRCSEG